MKKYQLNMRCDGVGESRTITAESAGDATEQAAETTSEWMEGGEWGDDGARVSASWTLVDEDGDEIDSGWTEVEIEPNHAKKIKEAAGSAEICGTDPDDHDWTSEGEGGCSENPGVWNTGGTSMSFASHCRECGLHRTKRVTGSQRNPGDHDTVEYRMLDKEET